MRIVVLGGTGFLSTWVVRAALARGHEVVAVSRGRRGDPPAGARAVVADRDDAASLAAALRDARPDAVVDVCGYTVAGARAAGEVLGGVGRYVYVSSISAYSGWPPGPVPDESAPTFPSTADLTEYGPMKAESERVLVDATDGRALLVRAGLIVGPGDRTRRLTAWLHRFATRPRVAVPDGHDQPIGVVDARDLADFLVRAAEERWSGPVNATGPVGMTTFGGVLEVCRATIAATGGTPGEPVVVPGEELVAAGVRPWWELPLWLPADAAPTAWQVGTARAQELGLAVRPIEDTIRDTWDWLRGLPDGELVHELPDALAALTD